jgi:hypothetical protein
MHNQEDQRDDEEDPGNFPGYRRNAGQAQCPGNQTQDQEDQRILQHRDSPLINRVRTCYIAALAICARAQFDFVGVHVVPLFLREM